MGFDISYIIRAIDEFSEPTKRITENVGKLESKLKFLDRRFKMTSDSLHKLGKTSSMYLSAPIAGLKALSLEAFDKADRAITKVQGALKSTGGTAKLTFAQIQQAANEIQDKTTFSHTRVLDEVSSNLLRFSNIQGQNFLRAQKAIVNISAAKDMDLGSVASLFGRAMSNPERGFRGIAKILGVTKKTSDAIAEIAKSGNLELAQEIILRAAKKKFGTSAEDLAKSGLGPIKQLFNELEDVFEEFGKDVFETLNPYIEIARQYVKAFKALNPETKKQILLIAGLVAWIGPLLIGLSILVTVLGVLVTPIGVAVVSIMALTAALIWLWKNIPRWSWSAFKERFSNDFIHGGIFGAQKQGFNTEGLKALVHGDFRKAKEIYKAHVQININDKNNNVKSVNTQHASGIKLNVGKNMAHIAGLS